MPPSVAIVTDSTAYLPAVPPGVTVVPLQVIVGGRPYDEGTQAGIGEWTPVTTSRPAPHRFAEVYAEAFSSGASGVVSVHLSGDLSGTAEAARLAAAEAAGPVEVVDSRSIAMGLGFPVLAAVRAAGAGRTLEEVATIARTSAARTQTYFYVDTLEYLRRGGRIGAAATLVGSALAIKPLLRIDGGRIVPLEKVRTAARAIARLEDLAVAAAGFGAAGEEPVDVAVQHLSAQGRAEALAERLAKRLRKLVRLSVVEVGAVIGVHVGPGALGITVSPSS
ncbi:DegV family protein [Nonomuraea sp. NPDC059194]|uniref:DegV family protein n=1 Tax=Nonomuraea sp. NPDC059194 TaxID=3346764 RepID=UPI0036819C09